MSLTSPPLLLQEPSHSDDQEQSTICTPADTGNTCETRARIQRSRRRRIVSLEPLKSRKKVTALKVGAQIELRARHELTD
jgi:hypothetical protein